MDSQRRARGENHRRQRAQEESDRQQRAQEDSDRRQRAQEDSDRRQRAQEDSDRRQRAQEDSDRRHNAQQESERRQTAEQEYDQQQRAQRAYRTSDYTPQQRKLIDGMAAAFVAIKARELELAKKRGMGRSKRPSCFSTNVDPNCRSFWTYPRPTPTSNPEPNNSGYYPRYTSSTLDPNCPIFHPRTMPGRTV